MDLTQRVAAFAELGNYIDGLLERPPSALFEKTHRENGWFTQDNVELALAGVRKFLHKETLLPWINAYANFPTGTKNVGVAMAGNIPLVGFHDFMCVLITGNRLVAKLSSQDSSLMSHLSSKLVEIEPGMSELIEFRERLSGVDAVIATGSDNTARYFEYYFRNIPHIIRKNRTSCAILRGDENDQSLESLGQDVFSYFGLGCRNVSKIFVPADFDLTKILAAWESYQGVQDHSKYFNNYEYQKSILLVNGYAFLDNGFVMLREDPALVSPVSLIYCETYSSLGDLRSKLEDHRLKIQCVVSANGWWDNSIPFGKAQFPDVGDYADQMDTIDFLSRI